MKKQNVSENIILIIEDDFDLMWMIHKLLANSGFQVLTAVTASQAIEVFSRYIFQISAVILDLSLPDKDGEAVATEFLKVAPNIPIIITTGSEDHAQRARLERIGVAAYLIKPFDLTELVQTIEQLIQHV